MYYNVDNHYFIWQLSVSVCCRLVYHINVAHKPGGVAAGRNKWQLSDKITKSSDSRIYKMYHLTHTHTLIMTLAVLIIFSIPTRFASRF